MSVRARSLGSTGRPVFGRPVAAVVVALIAIAVGAPAAVAGEIPAVGDAAAEVRQANAAPPVEVTPVAPPPAEPGPVAAAPVEPAPVESGPESAPVESAPVEPGPVESGPVEPPHADPLPAGPPAGDPPPTDPPPAEAPAAQVSQPAAQDAPPPPPPAAPASGAHSVAHNTNKVIQAVWQLQQGCRTHCYGTSQTQRSVQVSETTQSATALSGASGGGESSARAVNESSTIQFVWQMQIGCVAFCFDTSQTQEASQHSSTVQEADAESALTAWAENLAETVQYVFQIQQGCEHECHGAAQHQSIAQGHTTSQSATATGGADDVGYGSFLVPDWLIAYAENIGATIQTIYQYQEALCLEHCIGDTQLQEAAQRAETDQRAVAMADPPVPEEPPVGEGPPGEQPPGEQPPGEQPPGEQPPREQPPVEQPIPAGPSAPPEQRAATPSASGPASPVRPASLPGRRRTRTVRRQELELRAGAQADRGPRPGGGPGRGHTRSSGGGPGHNDGGGVAGQAGLARAEGHGLGVAFLPGRAGGSSRLDTTGATARDHTRAAAEQPAARAFSAPSVPGPGGSLSWLAILLAAAALMALGATLRRQLATRLTQT